MRLFAPCPATVVVDLHGKNQFQAKIALNSALRSASAGVVRIRVIHGFHLGTELRDMVRAEFASHPRVLRVARGDNDGQTDLFIKPQS